MTSIKATLNKNSGIGFWFYLLVFLPGSFSLYLGASSMMLGMLLWASLFSIRQIVTHKTKLNINWLVYVLFFSVLLIAHYFLVGLVYNGQDVIKFFFSILLLAFFLIVTSLIVEDLSLRKEFFLDKAKRLTLFMLFLGFLSYAIIFSGVVDRKPMIFFVEPSHYAMALIPLLMFVMLTSKFKRSLIYSFLVITLALVLESSTLLVGWLLVFCIINLNSKSFLLFSLLSLSLVIFFNIEKLEYFISRATITSSSDNLSVLVYVSGFERAYLTFVDSFGVGTGFQQMGVVGPIGAAQLKLNTLNFGELNLYDGGTVSSKLIVELGGAGLLLIVLYFLGFAKILKQLKHGGLTELELFFASYYLSFIIDLFIRGAGYFTPNVILFFAAVYFLFFKKTYQLEELR